jgi:hypothetical protein
MRATRGLMIKMKDSTLCGDNPQLCNLTKLIHVSEIGMLLVR